MLRAQGAKEEEMRGVEAGMAAAVRAAQGTYIMDRVAVHLGQQQARSERRRRRRARVFSAEGRRRQQEGAQAEQAVAEGAQAKQAVEGEALVNTVLLRLNNLFVSYLHYNFVRFSAI